MKYAIVSWIRRVFAALLALFITVPGGTTPVEKERPAANAITAYDEEAADYRLTVNVEEEIHDISDLLFGVFFEDINFAGDGGLYAEMVANRSFEFTTLAAGDQLYRWQTVGGADAQVAVGDAAGGLNENNTNYLVLANAGEAPAGIENTGFLEGMAIEAGKPYAFSLYARALDGYAGGLTVRLTAGGAVAAEGEIPALGTAWQQYALTLTPTLTASENVTLQVLLGQGGAAHQIGSPVRVSRQRPADLHDLLLIDNAAVGFFQNRLQQRVIVMHLFRIGTRSQILRNRLHRPGAVKRNHRNQVGDILRAHLHQHAADAV